jgi:Retroviral aspartyl protease
MFSISRTSVQENPRPPTLLPSLTVPTPLTIVSKPLDVMDIPILTTSAEINNVPCTITIDSGSSRDLISLQFMNKHANFFKIQKLSVPVMFTFGNGTQGKSDKAVQAHLKLQDVAGLQVSLTISSIESQIILGRPFLKSNQAVVDHARDVLIIRDQEIPLTADQGNQIQSVSAEVITDLMNTKHHHLFIGFVKPHVPTPKSPDFSTAPPEIQSLLAKYVDVFQDKQELPPTRSIEHKIPLLPDHKPYARAPYQLSYVERQELEKQLQELLRAGRIKPSQGPYGAPVLFVRKQDGSLRFCVDYRRLNNDTAKDPFALPRIQDLLDSLYKSNYFSTFDLANGYWQIGVQSRPSQNKFQYANGIVYVDSYAVWSHLSSSYVSTPHGGNIFS